MIERLVKVGRTILALKELEYGIEPDSKMSLRDRQTRLVNRLLCPLEEQWLGAARSEEGVQIRIKNLRMKIFPQISKSDLEPNEIQQRWRAMHDTYLAQQVDCYPGRYVRDFPSVDRVLETLEKFEEDLTEQARVHGQMKVVIQVGDPIEVSTKRERASDGDPLMSQIKDSITGMLQTLQHESKMCESVV